MIEDPKPTFKEWCVLELMGHRKLAGLVTEQEIAGHGFLRLDIYLRQTPITVGPDTGPIPIKSEAPVSTQFYSPSSVYAITPVSEETARRFAEGHQPEPVTRWELPLLPSGPRPEGMYVDPDDDDDEEATT